MSISDDWAALTLDGCLQGARMTLPLLPSIIVFAAAFGSASPDAVPAHGRQLAAGRAIPLGGRARSRHLPPALPGRGMTAEAIAGEFPYAEIGTSAADSRHSWFAPRLGECA